MSVVIGEWKAGPLNVLAPRELEGVLHCANDRTVKEAAKEMGISPETLKKRLESARLKLKASSIRALVLEAFKRGVISPAAALALILAVGGAFGDDQKIKIRRGKLAESKIELRASARRCGISLNA